MTLYQMTLGKVSLVDVYVGALAALGGLPDILSWRMDTSQSGAAQADLAGTEWVNVPNKTRTVIAVRVPEPTLLHLSWSDGRAADLDMSAMLDDRAFATLCGLVEFARL